MISDFTGLSLIFFSALMVGFSGAVVPGPMFTIIITNSATRGLKTAVLTIIGHAVTESVITILFLAGMLKYLNNPVAIKVIGIAGGAALLYLAFDLIYSSIKDRIKIDISTEEKKGNNFRKKLNSPFFQGVFVSVINPYWYIWWVTIGAAFLLKSIKFGYTGTFLFYLGHISSDFIWYIVIGFLVSRGRKYFNRKVYRAIFILCGIFLVYLGIKFIIDFIRK